jgi:hypothetical protein
MYERMAIEAFLWIAFLLGLYWTRIWDYLSFQRLTFRYWRKGWHRVKDSPWTLWEKKFPNNIVHRAISPEGMDEADKRYGDHGTPNPYQDEKVR